MCFHSVSIVSKADWQTLDKINGNCKCYFKSDILLVPLTLLGPPPPPLGPFLVLSGRPGCQSKVVHSLHSEPIVKYNQSNHLPERDVCGEFIFLEGRIRHLLQLYNLCKQALSILIPYHKNSNHLNNQISLFRLLSPLKTISLDNSKSSDPTFPLCKASAIQNTPTALHYGCMTAM